MSRGIWQITDFIKAPHSLSTAVNIEELSSPDSRNSYLVQYPKLDLSYFKNSPPCSILREFTVVGTVEGTPTQIFNSLYGGRRTVRLSDNLLKRKQESSNIIDFGRDIIFINGIPAFVIVNLYEPTPPYHNVKRIYLGQGIFTCPGGLIAFLNRKIIPEFIYDGFEIKVMDMYNWKVIQDNSIFKMDYDTEALLLDHIDEIYGNCNSAH